MRHPLHRPCGLCWPDTCPKPVPPMTREAEDSLILHSLPQRYLDDDGDGYGGVPFISLSEAVHVLTLGREAALIRALDL